MIAYLLLKPIQLESKRSFSLQQIARLISLNLTSRRSILALLHPEPDRKKGEENNQPSARNGGLFCLTGQ